MQQNKKTALEAFTLSSSSINTNLRYRVLPAIQERIDRKDNQKLLTATTTANSGLFDASARIPRVKNDDYTSFNEQQLSAQTNNQNTTHSGALDLSFVGNEQNFVLRYICCTQLPIVINARLPSNEVFANANVIALPKQNEIVAVFDDLPVFVGEQAFVRVQRSVAPYHSGWFPLFWLHAIASEKVTQNMTMGMSYQGISRQIRQVVQQVFHQNCDNMNPVGGPATFELPGPPSKNYKCGEYPVGDTSATFFRNGENYRYLNSQRFFRRGFEHRDQYFRVGHSDANFNFPIYISDIDSQSRAAEDYAAQELKEEGYAPLTRTYFKTQEARDDGEVRVHAMDWYFKTWFEDSEPRKSQKLRISLRTNLPGFSLYSPLTEQQFRAWAWEPYNGDSEVTISHIKLGGMRIEHIPLRIDGIVEINIDNNTDNISNTFEVASSDSIAIRFTDARITKDPKLSFYETTEYAPVATGNSSVVPIALGYVEQIVDNILADGTFVWELISDNVLSSVLASLESLHPQLMVLFQSPSNLALDACKFSMPSAYQSRNSNFYAFYRQCIDFASSVEDVAFDNDPANQLYEGYGFTQSPTYWANVNEAGLLWRKADSDRQSFPCPGDASCSVYIDRPWWAAYNPRYEYVGGDKFDPDAWNYNSGRGGKALVNASATTSKHYWHFMRCLLPNVDQKLNANVDDFVTRVAENTPNECRLSALETVCELYGEGEDLEQLFAARWGIIPQLSGYTNYCQWAEELREDDDGELPLTINQ
jgi:hypothetical protein